MLTIKVFLIIIFSLVGIAESMFPPNSFTTATLINKWKLNTKNTEVWELLSASSYVPEEELHIHIAGGYFSYFESKTGQSSKTNSVSLPNTKPEFHDSTQKNQGLIKIVLSKLGYKSRFVYLPVGKLIFSNRSKDTEIFTLNKLDYVQIPNSDITAYRLIAVNPENNRKASLITTTCGTNIPRLIGKLYIEDNNNLESYNIKICGRNENDAERHLWNKIKTVSVFTIDHEGNV